MVAYIAQDLPDFFVHENSHLFQHARLEQRFPMYDVMSVKMSPHQFGVPNTRHRLLSIGVLKRSGALETLFTPLELEAFMCTADITAEQCFFVADKQDIECYVTSEARRKGIIRAQTPLDVMAAGDFVRMQVLRYGGVEPGQLAHQSGTCDSRQTKQRTRLVQHNLGALTTKALPVSLGLSRQMLPKEMLWAMGIPVYTHLLPSEFQGAFACPFQALLSKLPAGSLTKLAGNGMSLVIIGHTMGFVLANLVTIKSKGITMSSVWHDSDDHASAEAENVNQDMAADTE